MEDRIIDKIVANEVTNDGKQAHLYYDQTRMEHQAYGISAYIVTHVIATEFPTFSAELQMPMVLVDDSHISKLKKKLEEIIHIDEEYYLFEAEQKYNEADYACWVEKVRG